MTNYIDLLAAHDKLEIERSMLLGILSRLQSEHSDLIERENVLESKLAAVPQYVFWCLNERERGRMVFPSLNEWLGEQDSIGVSVEDAVRLGYAVWVRCMTRVPFGVILRKAMRGGDKTIVAYGAGATVSEAIGRALAKIEARRKVSA